MKATMNMADQAVTSSREDHKIIEYLGTMKSSTEEEPPKKSRRAKASSKKEALMKTIAQEMVNSLLGKEEDGDEGDILRSFNDAVAEQSGPSNSPSVSKPKKKRTSKIEKVPQSSESSPDLSKPKKKRTSTIERVPQSDESLADLYYARMAGEEYVVTAEDSVTDSNSKRSQVSASRSEGSDLRRLTGSGSSSSGSDESGELSVDEILEHVMASIPKEIRDQIPEEMWKQIFGQQVASDLPIDGIPLCTDDDDDLSVRSDLTGFVFSEKPVPPITDDSYDIDPRKNRSDAICPTFALHDAPDNRDPFDKNNDSPFSDKPRSTRTKRTKSLSHKSEDVEASPKPSSTKRNSSYNHKSEHLKASPPRHSSRKVPSETVKRGSSIKFDQVEVRHYERIACDNPSVQGGPAIGIGWRFYKGGHIDVDEWELRKGCPRKSTELVLARAARERILMEAGCTQKEIADMIRATLKVKNQRITTLNNLSAAGIEEAVEAAQKKMAGMLKFGREKNLVKS
jgi:hypothetical protein